ncbi:unnamed protein product [Urochloa humidicola]
MGVVGRLVSELLHGQEMHSNDFFCKGFGFGDGLIVSFCASLLKSFVRFLVLLLCFLSLEASSPFPIANQVGGGRMLLPVMCSSDLCTSREFSFGGLITSSMELGWFVPTICLDGSAPLLGSSSSGGLGILVAWGVGFLKVWRCDDCRSSLLAGAFNGTKACRRCATQDGDNKFLFFAGEEVGSRCGFRPSEARKTGRCCKDLCADYASFNGVFALLQGPVCNLCTFLGCLCNMGCNYLFYQ